MEEARRIAPAEIHINTAEIPDWNRDRLAAATLALIRSIQKQPGGREALEASSAMKN